MSPFLSLSLFLDGVFRSSGLFPGQEKTGYMWEGSMRKVVVAVMGCLIASGLVMSMMVFVEAVYMTTVVIIVKLLRRTPEKVHKWEAMKDDVELAHSNYPMVLIQIPMFNEKEVCELSIGAACRMSWPWDRMIIQVLDDSTDLTCKELVKEECGKWARKGVNIKSEVRDNRNGYKAGALKAGMKHVYVKHCDYVAIFDADFQPDPDFLARTIPFLLHNPDLALVQARWKFVNANECLMTRIQEMSLNYHFMAEQECGSSLHAFFGFNGTAGVWRISALKEAGGWKDRTTVEDMDLAVRACLQGWKFVFVGDIQVKSELPSSFETYRFQQHRWSCGPANLFRKMTMEIMESKRVSLWKKAYLIYNFFIVRKIVVHMFTFVFYCLILPASVLFPEVEIPQWATIYVPTAITILNVMATPRSFHLLVFWVLFENVMAMHRTKAALIGLVEAGRVDEWVVTEKTGHNTLKAQLVPAKPWERRRSGGVHWEEVAVGLYMLVCGCYDMAFGRTYLFVYLFLQSIAFFVAGVGFLGTPISCS
ncbi:PREDICTED: probable mannan synthase 11 isoform X3 [Tarenaya hassleriana]|uniref:probable mannan synthase 11 isoform X3 n=1 Tax=Tarenaya hassleriana TaxID=28532 RepID=UPI00053C2E07|nr:PREDICTED: probable mannan synthase 11 isoform X3 [Tarenaya hassleriana]